ncbi:MAG: hypothetical protein WD625_11200 [Balneolales bacterium]
MDILSTEELSELVEKRNPHSLSLYMPSHKTGEGMMQDPIRIKNLLKQAESSLREKGVRHVHDFLEPIEAKMNDQQFMQHMNDGLAVFRTPEMTRFYRLPINFEELVIVNERLHIKPLLPLFSENGKFYTLALSQKKVRLFHGTRNTITELEIKDVPLNFQEYLKLNEYEKSQQFHTETARTPGEGTRAAVFFGHEADNEIKEQIGHWFREIDRVVAPSLNGGPLLVYGVEYLHPIYHKVNNYNALLDKIKVTGNPDALKPREIHNKAWQAMEPYFAKAREQDVDRFQELAGTGKTASTINDAVAAAAHGRVDVLFVPRNGHYWGVYNPEEARVKKMERGENGSEDLIDLAAVYTVVNSGKVYTVDQDKIPGEGEIAGVFRY